MFIPGDLWCQDIHRVWFEEQNILLRKNNFTEKF